MVGGPWEYRLPEHGGYAQAPPPYGFAANHAASSPASEGRLFASLTIMFYYPYKIVIKTVKTVHVQELQAKPQLRFPQIYPILIILSRPLHYTKTIQPQGHRPWGFLAWFKIPDFTYKSLLLRKSWR
jgi:hypothetical protein